MRDGSISPADSLSLVAPMIATFLLLISPAVLAQNATNSSSEIHTQCGFQIRRKER